MSIESPIGFTQDRNFLQIVIPGPQGMELEIETTSPSCVDDFTCANPGTDTDMQLWGACNNGFEDSLIARDITGDSGVGWLSKIQTECLPPGTYYLEVKGQFGNAPQNFDVEVRQTSSCTVQLADVCIYSDTSNEICSLDVDDNPGHWDYTDCNGTPFGTATGIAENVSSTAKGLKVEDKEEGWLFKMNGDYNKGRGKCAHKVDGVEIFKFEGFLIQSPNTECECL